MDAAINSAAVEGLVSFRERGEGPPLLLLHGLMINGAMFEPVVDHFAAAHRVIIPDLRGYGRSRYLPPPYTAAALAADLARLLDHLRLKSAAVLGYSHGGAIGQQFALDHPQRCERLVLVCTYAFNQATLREKIEGRLMPLVVRIVGMKALAKIVMAQGLKNLDRKRAVWVKDLMAGEDDRLMIAAWRSAMTFDSRPRLGEIRCPTLIIAAANDEAVGFHHAEELHAGIGGSQLLVIDGATHALIWARPDALVRAAAPFLAS